VSKLSLIASDFLTSAFGCQNDLFERCLPAQLQNFIEDHFSAEGPLSVAGSVIHWSRLQEMLLAVVSLFGSHRGFGRVCSWSSSFDSWSIHRGCVFSVETTSSSANGCLPCCYDGPPAADVAAPRY